MVRGNPRELREARRRERVAVAEREGVEALPRRRGQRVRWTSNGLVWRRVGDDAWKCEDGFDFGPSTSAHIASMPWEPVRKFKPKLGSSEGSDRG